MEIALALVTGFIALIAALGGQFFAHRLQSERDREEYERRRQDTADDAERTALLNMIRACGEMDRALSSIAVRSTRYKRHGQFAGVVVPIEDLLIFEEARANFVTAYSALKSDNLANNAAQAVQASYDALFSLTTNDLNDLGAPFSTAKYRVGAIMAWARLLYYGRAASVDWTKPPLRMVPMSNHPLDRMLREGTLRAHRPVPEAEVSESEEEGVN